MIDVSELAGNKKDIQLKPIRERASSVTAYRLILLAVLRDIRKAVNDDVLPAYQLDKSLQRDSAGWFASVKQSAERAVSTAVEKYSALFTNDSDRHWRRFTGVIKSAAKIALPKAARPPDERLLEAYIGKNAALIKSLSDETISRVERIIFDGKLAGTSVTEISKQIQLSFGIMRRRADLIAVDQMASLNADLNEARLKAVGVYDYTWRGELDSRERQLHLNLEGKRYKFGQRTGAENGLPPGKPIRCRCVAAGIIAGRSHKRTTPKSQIAQALAAAALAALLSKQEEEENNGTKTFDYSPEAAGITEQADGRLFDVLAVTVEPRPGSTSNYRAGELSAQVAALSIGGRITYEPDGFG